jgi:hypothetical protein
LLKKHSLFLLVCARAYIYNSIGTFLRDGDIDSHTFFQIWNPLAIKEVWTRIEPLIKEWREYYEHPALFESIEYLGKEALNIYPIKKEVYQ